ncbi:hypothetical protein THRCLA_01368 [Thraustotheca clavata]|uniref:Transmembrane protein n=1 Tax=Thraustotheca clavata TaxID=74557 RepID=A0A1W0A8P3_9STRA|nr:hypothetical protein THRCLA_01368 [Thraustotheca clavata]
MAYFDGALPSKITAADNAQKLSTTLNLNMGSASVALNPTTSNLWAPILESFQYTYSMQIPLTSGSITMFPLDEYTAPILVQATALLSANTTTPYRFPVHLSIYTKGDFNWKYVDSNLSEVIQQVLRHFSALLLMGMGATKTMHNISLRELTVRAYRHPLFFSYVGIMWLGIWIVTMCLLYIASVTIIWNRKPVDNPMIYFSGLIAVPLFRNTCPGCLFDITSTYISLTVVFASMLIAAFLSMAQIYLCKLDFLYDIVL